MIFTSTSAKKPPKNLINKEKMMSTQTETNQDAAIEFQRAAYLDVCTELRDILKEEKELAKRKEELKTAVLQLSGGDRMEYGIRVQKRTAKGTNRPGC